MSDIDNGICTMCNLPISYDETTIEDGGTRDDESCLRTKPYCTNEDEHVDWRATCLHVQECARKAEALLATAVAERDAAVRERDELRDWRDNISNVIKSAPEFAPGEWAGDKEGWGYHFEIVAYVLRDRASLSAALATATARAEAAEKERDSLLSNYASPTSNALIERVAKAAREAIQVEERERIAQFVEDNLHMINIRDVTALELAAAIRNAHRTPEEET